MKQDLSECRFRNKRHKTESQEPGTEKPTKNEVELKETQASNRQQTRRDTDISKTDQKQTLNSHTEQFATPKQIRLV